MIFGVFAQDSLKVRKTAKNSFSLFSIRLEVFSKNGVKNGGVVRFLSQKRENQRLLGPLMDLPQYLNSATNIIGQNFCQCFLWRQNFNSRWPWGGRLTQFHCLYVI